MLTAPFGTRAVCVYRDVQPEPLFLGSYLSTSVHVAHFTVAAVVKTEVSDDG